MTWKYDELKLALTAYNNALDALLTLYKDEYNVDELVMPQTIFLHQILRQV